jgi:hypothetical protein
LASGDGAHEVSILIGTVGRYRGVEPRSKVSMMIMRPPQQGQGYESACGPLSPPLSASVGAVSIAARVIGNACVRTRLTARDMAAESRRAAVLDG